MCSHGELEATGSSFHFSLMCSWTAGRDTEQYTENQSSYHPAPSHLGGSTFGSSSVRKYQFSRAQRNRNERSVVADSGKCQQTGTGHIGLSAGPPVIAPFGTFVFANSGHWREIGRYGEQRIRKVDDCTV